MRYPPTARVRAKADFDRIFRHGRRKALPVLALHCLDTGNPPRLGLAVSRKVDKRAVGRNRIKRILREHFRLSQNRLALADFVVVARPGAAELSAIALKNAFDSLVKRCDGLKSSIESDAGTPHLSPLNPPQDAALDA